MPTPANEAPGRPVEMNENKRTLSGNDGFIPVEQNESLFWKAWDKSGNGGGQSERQKEYSESRVREASLSSVVVLQALDVIFAEVSPSLDFDEDQRLFAGVFNAMGSSNRNVNRIACGEKDLCAIECDPAAPGDSHPMFGSL